MMLHAYRRKDGSCGIRNHLFAMPAVVCANQVAINAARQHPALKIVEHQHGCAQIGADHIQTKRVFTQYALHANVYATMMIGLGCEGIIAKNLFAESMEKNSADKPIDLVIIQESGGTVGSSALVRSWADQKEAEASTSERTPMDWSELRVGVLVDSLADKDLSSVKGFLEALADTGAQMIIAQPYEKSVRDAIMPEEWMRESSSVAVIPYAEASTDQHVMMTAASTPLETATGLVASGAQVVVHLAAEPHGFGNPIAPIVRFSVDQALYDDMSDDFDGQIATQPELALQTLSEIINGSLCAAEAMVMDDFAIYRIGPTV